MQQTDRNGSLKRGIRGLVAPLAFVTLLLTAASYAQAKDGDAIDFDAVAAAPDSHKVLFETDAVRVLRVEIAPGATEPVHEHTFPSIMIIEKPQPLVYVVYEMVGGEPVESQRIEVPLMPADATEEMGPEGLHAVQNLGTEPFVAIRVEFKE
ncbi:hypothetical protein [Citromicrobium bathyomarinum]|uniref:hypothetical protein n=1 Tax=Citromicrobium bathyomarinum TaxID=72174 RepID=UPI003159D750